MQKNDYQTWRFTALDTWFFREARPFDTIGAPELDSLFPPPAATVAGAIKTLIGERLGLNWRRFKPKRPESSEDDSKAAALGWLRLQGPFLSLQKNLLFPVPLFLLAKEQEFCRLQIGEAVETDLGVVHLPRLPIEKHGYKPLEKSFLTAAGLKRVLAGGLPDPKDVVKSEKLYVGESRFGIARDNRRGTVRKGRLYQTRHVRPQEEVAIEVGVGGVDPDLLPETAALRLGGEGRLALVEAEPQPLNLLSLLPEPEPKSDACGLILILLTPADLDGTWYPPVAKKEHRAQENGWPAQCWCCTLRGVELQIQSAVIGKPWQGGGWSLVERKPRRVESLVPAGSAWYCQVKNMALKEAISRLHLQQIGDGQQLGRGLLAVGLWQNQEFECQEKMK